MGFWVGCHGAAPVGEAGRRAVAAMAAVHAELGHRVRTLALSPNCHAAWCWQDDAEATPPVTETASAIWLGDVALYNRDVIAMAADDRTAQLLGAPADLALLARHIERCGDAAMGRVNGDFAVARIDRTSGELTLWRDAFGVRTFYHTRHGAAGQATTCFASLVPPLLRLADAPAGPSPFSLGAALLLGAPMLDHTYFDAIRAVPPGRSITFVRGAEPRITRYWAPRPGVLPSRRDDDVVAATRAALVRAVEARLPADAPGAVMLSGGLDSATIAAAACSARPDRRLYSVTTVLPPGYTGPETDERAHVETLAARYANLVPLFEDGSTIDPLSSLKGPLRLNGPREDPFDAMSLGMLRQLADHGVRVVLTGYAGDDGISGHGPSFLVESLMRLRPRRAAEEVARLRAEGASLATILRRHLAMPFVPLWALRARWRLLGTDWLANKALRPQAFRELRLHEHMQAYGRDRSLRPGLTVAADEAANLAMYQADGGLSSDLHEAATGVKVRHALMDVDLLATVLAVPFHLKARGPYKRALIREVAAPWLPRSIATRRDKGHADPIFRSALAAREADLRSAFARFRRDPLWAYLVDEAKVAQGLARLHDAASSESVDVFVMNTVDAPYRLGRFLDAWRDRESPID